MSQVLIDTERFPDPRAALEAEVGPLTEFQCVRSPESELEDLRKLVARPFASWPLSSLAVIPVITDLITMGGGIGRRTFEFDHPADEDRAAA